MNTTIFQAEINNSDLELVQSFLKRLKAKNIIIKKDDTKMTKDQYFRMIDEARKEKTTRMTVEEMRAKYLK